MICWFKWENCGIHISATSCNSIAIPCAYFMTWGCTETVPKSHLYLGLHQYLVWDHTDVQFETAPMSDCVLQLRRVREFPPPHPVQSHVTRTPREPPSPPTLAAVPSIHSDRVTQRSLPVSVIGACVVFSEADRRGINDVIADKWDRVLNLAVCRGRG